MKVRTKFIDYDAVTRIPKPGVPCCIVCQRSINGRPTRYVYVSADMHAVHPSDLAKWVRTGTDYGWHEIGSDCAKRLGLEWTVESLPQ